MHSSQMPDNTPAPVPLAQLISDGSGLDLRRHHRKGLLSGEERTEASRGLGIFRKVVARTPLHLLGWLPTLVFCSSRDGLAVSANLYRPESLA